MTKQYALLILIGTKEDPFTKLLAYTHNLVKNNPGTVTEIKTNDDDRLEFVYIVLGCSVSSNIFFYKKYTHESYYYFSMQL